MRALAAAALAPLTAVAIAACGGDGTATAPAPHRQTASGSRCLKRHLARRFHHLLSLPAETPQPDPGTSAAIIAAHPPRDTTTAGAAPARMPCIR